MRKALVVGAVVAVVVGAAAVLASIAMSQPDAKTSMDIEKQHYVALGDSVAAGIGLADYSDASACNRTKQSYPERLAAMGNYELISYACSGATIAKGIIGTHTVNDLMLEPQLDRMFALSDTPDVITLSVGANDIDWTRFVACYTTECPVAEYRNQVDTSLLKLNADLSDVLSRIGQRYGETIPKVIVTGYYDLLPLNTPATCQEISGIDDAEKELVRFVSSGLNDTISRSVEPFPYATFADIDFKGHELCTENTWIQGIDGKTPFHPTSSGQQAIAKQIDTVIRSK